MILYSSLIHVPISYFIIVYISLKVEEVTVVSDDGTNGRDDELRGGDVLVSSHYDETGGVAKVDVSNMNYYTSFITFPIYPSLTHISKIYFITHRK